MNTKWKQFPIIKNPDGTFNVTHDTDGSLLPYNVCPLDIDPANIFDIEEVSAFWESLPDGDPRKQIYVPPIVEDPIEEKSIEQDDPSIE